jgi:hypothetical protein
LLTRERLALTVLALAAGILAAAAPAAPPAPSASTDPAKARELIPGVPAPVVRPTGKGWFGHESRLGVPAFNDQFPGIDLSPLGPEARERWLQRANTEPCPCSQSGCLRHSLAFCFKVDPQCPLARRLLVEMMEKMTPPAPAAP